jgi:FtsP/CotA-like multicopper oxidase with cupredoxin domain
VIVHFRNELPDHTTVHFHGPRVPAFADGSHASQHPIHPGEGFDYRFTVRDAGSFWYHPHFHGYDQIERGLYGPIVFEGGVAPDVTADRYLVLDDVKLARDGREADEITDGDRMFGREGNVLLVNGKHAPVDLTVPAGARERWRIVNASNGRYFNLRLPGVRFLVVGNDGGLLPEPFSTDTLLVVPGERYDVLVTFDAPPAALETAYYDRGQDERTAAARPLVRVALGAPARELSPLPAVWRDLPRLAVSPETPVRRFALGQKSVPGGALLFTINGEVWPDGTPVELRRGDVEIWDIANETGMDHPIHVHGAFFEVRPEDRIDRPGLDGWKDTVNVPRRSSLRFAIRFDTAGVWMLHCHILEHLDSGMLVNLIVRD